ncbi:hypothetical protein L195_g060253 [Trifolium pratense]|uniref:Uncharacterized protein n=1 Tax=Trifolium pratense TaxID=57577 RepID=A0A2K3K2R7_TRIPR|nr:hypothetical protein L195_g060253 [Trifolium pratense]
MHSDIVIPVYPRSRDPIQHREKPITVTNDFSPIGYGKSFAIQSLRYEFCIELDNCVAKEVVFDKLESFFESCNLRRSHVV